MPIFQQKKLKCYRLNKLNFKKDTLVYSINFKLVIMQKKFNVRLQIV